MQVSGIDRRTLLGLGATAAVAGTLAPRSAARAETVVGGRVFVTRRGAPLLAMVPPPDRPVDPETPAAEQDQLTHAVAILSDYVERATGSSLPIMTLAEWEAGDPSVGRIYVGWVGPDSAPGTAEALVDLDPDGYVISAHRETICICGPTDWGTRYGVYEFLERYVGVRWVLPGPDGDHVPQLGTITVPGTVLRHDPSFRSRVLPYLYKTHEPNAEDWTSDDPQVIWATRQRTHNRISSTGSHNLYNIFPTRVYADPTKDTYRPELYPIVNGKTKLPALGATSGWQPRFDTPESVEVAVTYALDFFATHPDEPLLGLGVNDRGGHSETDLDSDLINSNGIPSASGSYYTWVNAVVSEVLRREPGLADKYFPLLAYDNVIDPPSFDLHPAVVPMITRETHAWQDPQARAQLEDLITSWTARVENWAWYDYASGSRYLAPRMHVPVIATALQYAHAHGMRYQNCDLAPFVVGEGPKTWVYAKLLWDVDADVEALTLDWCRAAVGDAAAPHLRDYYAWWEEFWATAVPPTGWWQYNHYRTYFDFTLADYLSALQDGDLEHLQGLVSRMVAGSTSGTAAQQARAQLIKDGISYYEANVWSYPRRVPAPVDEAAALGLVASMTSTLDARIAAAQDRFVIEARHEADPVLRHRTDHRRYNHNWTGFNGSEFWHLVDHLRAHPADDDAVRVHLQQTVAGHPGTSAQRMAEFILATAGGARDQLAVNPSFEDGSAPWIFVNYVRRTEGIGYGGGIGLRLAPPSGLNERGREEAVVQSIDITPGLCAARIRYRVTSPEAHQGQLSLRMQLLSAGGAAIYTFQQPFVLVSEVVEDWSWIALCEDIPTAIKGVAVARVKVIVSLIKFDGTGEVHMDDAEVYAEHLGASSDEKG